jgi:hypothetical protein
MPNQVAYDKDGILDVINNDPKAPTHTFDKVNSIASTNWELAPEIVAKHLSTASVAHSTGKLTGNGGPGKVGS